MGVRLRLAVALGCVLASAPAALGQDADRAALLRDFATLKKGADKRLAEVFAAPEVLAPGAERLLPKTFHASLPAVRTALGETRLGIKMWGELFPSRKLVSLTEYKWGRREQFYLWVETTTPVRIAVYYKNDEKGGKTERFLPRPEDPGKVWKALLPGAYQVPKRMWTYDHGNPEELFVLVMADGAPNNPQPPGPAPDRGDFKEGLLAEPDGYFDQLDLVQRAVARNGEALRLAAPPARAESANPDDIALMGVVPGTRAQATIVFRKR